MTRKECYKLNIINRSKEVVIMASAKSMVDVAYDVIAKKKRAIPFSKLWEEVSKTYGVANDKIAQFYSDLTLDSRFVSLKENKWDLVERRKFEESHVDLSEIELDDDEPEEVEEKEDILVDRDEY